VHAKESKKGGIILRKEDGGDHDDNMVRCITESTAILVCIVNVEAEDMASLDSSWRHGVHCDLR
jgi:hypothetical protein